MLKLPNLQQAALDAATVDALFEDLATCTRVLSVVPKTTAQAFVAEQSIDLASAREGLRNGSFRAVQIRYQFEGKEWCDTLLAGNAGCAKIVRICTNDVLDSIESNPS